MQTLTHVTHRIPWLAAALALALVCAPSRDSRADEKRDLIGRIEDKLEDAADALERLPDDSNDGALDRARSLVSEARRYADDLGRIAEDDRDAKRIADDFDDHQDDFNDAVGSLRSLKAGQRLHEPITTMCTERDKELVRLARDFESKNDPDGLTELPREAGKLQDATKTQLEELKRNDDKMDDWSDDAQDFSADGPWRELSGMVDQVARATYDRWHRGHEAAMKACENLARGVEHPEVKDALAKLGSSAGGRKAIIEQLDKDARELGTVLGRVSEDSGMASVERARSLLGEIERGVDNLGRSATTDKGTKLILDKWPEGIKQLEAALEGLEHLKQHQHDMDALPEKCKQREHDLEEAIQKNGDDTDGIDEIPKLAEELAAPVRAGLEKAKERQREEDRDEEQARAISVTEGEWSDIRAAEQRAADATHKTFEDGLKKTASECENIAKGKDSRQAKEALEALNKHAMSTGDQLTSGVEAWVVDARATYLADCDAKKEMWEAECGSDREPSSEESDDDAKEVSARLESEMRAKMSPVLQKLPELEKQVDALLAKRETKAKAAPLAAMLKKERERLERLAPQGRWSGANRPYNQLATDYGKEQHGRMHSSFDCDLPKDAARQLRFDGADHLYPDCIIVTDRECKIIEFKADSKKGRRLARKQLDDYAKTVPTYYMRHLQNKTDPDSDYGGAELLKRIVAAGCAGSAGTGPIVFSTPEPSDSYYQMCAQPFQCIESN